MTDALNPHMRVSEPVRTPCRPYLFLLCDGHTSLPALPVGLSDGDHVLHVLPVPPAVAPAPVTLEGMAASMAHIIRDIQADGPYHLAAWCAHGTLAYQLGLHLLGQDQVVAFLGLVNWPAEEAVRIKRPSPSIPLTLLTSGKQVGGQIGSGLAGTHMPDDDDLMPTLLAASRAALVAPAQGMAELEYRSDFVIQTGARGHSPLFCMPGAGDNVTGFAPLASALGAAWPIIGFQPRGSDGELVPHTTVQAAAISHARAIQTRYPQGAVHLLGHSFGGWVAFEVACRLRAAGRDVASLTLLDSEAPGQAGGSLGREHTQLDVMLKFIECINLATPEPVGIDRAMLETIDPSEHLSLVHARMVRFGLIPSGSRPSMLLGTLSTFNAALRTQYSPSDIYEGAVRLVLIHDTQLSQSDNELEHHRMAVGWRRHAPSLRCWHGPGNHMTVLKPPHVAELSHWWLAGLGSRSKTEHVVVSS